MITWTNKPPEDLPYAEVRLLRAPPRGKLSAYILSDDILGTNTHYWHSRTTPCTGRDCDPCREHFPWRWHGYLAVYDPVTHTPGVIELTKVGGDQVAKYRASAGSLRGTVITLWRPQSRPNGRIAVKLERGAIPVQNLPPPLDLVAFLALLWNAPADPAISPAKNHQPTEHKRHSPETPPGHSPSILKDLLHVVMPE